MAAPLHLNFAISIFIELVHKYLLQITKYWLANYKGCGEFCLYFHALNLHCKLLLMARELEIPFMWGERERERERAVPSVWPGKTKAPRPRKDLALLYIFYKSYF